MSSLYYLTVITKPELSESCLDFFNRCGIASIFSVLCNGTAQKKVLDYLGIEKTEKIKLTAMVSGENIDRIMTGLRHEMGIEVPGNGIAVTIPVSSLDGAACMQYLTEGQEIHLSEVKDMTEAKYSLIIAVAAKGSSDFVMDAAREAGASGGTVVHAKGTATEFTTKFFGMSIAAEKEMIYIVSKKSDKNTIMKAIKEKAGVNTEAQAVVFSLPVDDVAGLRSIEEI